MEHRATGTIHGSTIELDFALAVIDGQAVEVIVRTVPTPRPWGEGILKSAGGWCDYPEMDEIMERIHAERQLERPMPPTP